MQQAMLYTFMLIMPMILLVGAGHAGTQHAANPAGRHPVNPLRFAIDLVQRVYLEGVGLLTVVHDLIPLLIISAHYAAAGRLAVSQSSFMNMPLYGFQ